MGHWCRICGLSRPNEQFSGKGHKTHVCKRCQAMPKAERESIEAYEEIFGFMRQKHISEKNIARLRVLINSQVKDVAMLAAIVLEVAEVKPYKKKRMGYIAHRYPDLMTKLETTGLIYAHGY